MHSTAVDVADKNHISYLQQRIACLACFLLTYGSPAEDAIPGYGDSHERWSIPMATSMEIIAYRCCTHTTSLLPMEAGRAQVLHAYDPTKTEPCACFAGDKMEAGRMHAIPGCDDSHGRWSIPMAASMGIIEARCCINTTSLLL